MLKTFFSAVMVTLMAISITTTVSAKTVILDGDVISYEIPNKDRVLALADSGGCTLLMITYKIVNGEIAEWLSEITVDIAEGGLALATASGNVSGTPAVKVACINGQLTVDSPFPEITF